MAPARPWTRLLFTSCLAVARLSGGGGAAAVSTAGGRHAIASSRGRLFRTEGGSSSAASAAATEHGGVAADDRERRLLLADEDLAQGALLLEGAVSRHGRLARSGGAKCPVPMWKANDFLCEEWASASSGQFWKDMSGDLRVSFVHDQKCKVKCPSGKWFQHPDITEILCHHGEWMGTADSQGEFDMRDIRGIDCQTSPIAKMVLIGVMVTKIILCAGGAMLISKKGGVNLSKAKTLFAGRGAAGGEPGTAASSASGSDAGAASDADAGGWAPRGRRAPSSEGTAAVGGWEGSGDAGDWGGSGDAGDWEGAADVGDSRGGGGDDDGDASDSR